MSNPNISQGFREMAAHYKKRRLLARETVSHSDIRWALQSFSPYRAPGPDRILPVLLQRTDDVLLEKVNLFRP